MTGNSWMGWGPRGVPGHRLVLNIVQVVLALVLSTSLVVMLVVLGYLALIPRPEALRFISLGTGHTVG